jgi:hypothetical protein
MFSRENLARCGLPLFHQFTPQFARQTRVAGREVGDPVRTDVSSNRASGDCDHDVSIQIATVGRYRGARPRSKISMMILRPQQQGHRCERVCGSLSSALSASLD